VTDSSDPPEMPDLEATIRSEITTEFIARASAAEIAYVALVDAIFEATGVNLRPIVQQRLSDEHDKFRQMADDQTEVMSLVADNLAAYVSRLNRIG
jgi:uncharacterized ferritin-like protein (DUF455 family)